MPGGREVPRLGHVLLGRLHGQGVAGPDLAVRVRVGGAHRLAPVLEHLDPPELPAELRGLVGPDVHDPADLGRTHPRQGQVVARREADHAAGAPGAFGAEQARLHPRVRRVRAEGGEVVGEHECRVVDRVDIAVHSRVAGAQVAAGVERRPLLRRLRLLGAQPGPPGAAGRDEHPLVGEGVPAAVRLGLERADHLLVRRLRPVSEHGRRPPARNGGRARGSPAGLPATRGPPPPARSRPPPRGAPPGRPGPGSCR